MKDRLLRYKELSVDTDTMFDILLEGFKTDPYGFSLGQHRDKVKSLLEDTKTYNRNCDYMGDIAYKEEVYCEDDYSLLTGLYLESLKAVEHNLTYDYLLESCIAKEYVCSDTLTLMEDYVNKFDIGNILEDIKDINKDLVYDKDTTILEFVSMSKVLSVAWKVILAVVGVVISQLLKAFSKNISQENEPAKEKVEPGSKGPFTERGTVDFNRWLEDIKKYYNNRLNIREAYGLKMGSGFMACATADILIASVKVAQMEGSNLDLDSLQTKLKKEFNNKVLSVPMVTGVSSNHFDNINERYLIPHVKRYYDAIWKGTENIKREIQGDINSTCILPADGEQALKEIAVLYNFKNDRLMKSLEINSTDEKKFTEKIKTELRELKADYSIARKNFSDSKVIVTPRTKAFLQALTHNARTFSNELDSTTNGLSHLRTESYSLLKKVYRNAEDIRHATLKK